MFPCPVCHTVLVIVMKFLEVYCDNSFLLHQLKSNLTCSF